MANRATDSRPRLSSGGPSDDDAGGYGADRARKFASVLRSPEIEEGVRLEGSLLDAAGLPNVDDRVDRAAAVGLERQDHGVRPTGIEDVGERLDALVPEAAARVDGRNPCEI